MERLSTRYINEILEEIEPLQYYMVMEQVKSMKLDKKQKRRLNKIQEMWEVRYAKN